MNANKIAETERRINAIARKVLHAIPVDEAHTLSRICGDMRNIQGINLDVSVIQGCVVNLKKLGLVAEPRTGEFLRVQAKAKVTVEAPPPESKTEASDEPLDRLAALAAKIKSIGMLLSEVALEVEEVALAVEDRIGNAAEENKKFAQLKALLNS